LITVSNGYVLYLYYTCSVCNILIMTYLCSNYQEVYWSLVFLLL